MCRLNLEWLIYELVCNFFESFICVGVGIWYFLVCNSLLYRRIYGRIILYQCMERLIWNNEDDFIFFRFRFLFIKENIVNFIEVGWYVSWF